MFNMPGYCNKMKQQLLHHKEEKEKSIIFWKFHSISSINSEFQKLIIKIRWNLQSTGSIDQREAYDWLLLMVHMCFNTPAKKCPFNSSQNTTVQNRTLSTNISLLVVEFNQHYLLNLCTEKKTFHYTKRDQNKASLVQKHDWSIQPSA